MKKMYAESDHFSPNPQPPAWWDPTSPPLAWTIPSSPPHWLPGLCPCPPTLFPTRPPDGTRSHLTAVRVPLLRTLYGSQLRQCQSQVLSVVYNTQHDLPSTSSLSLPRLLQSRCLPRCPSYTPSIPTPGPLHWLFLCWTAIAHIPPWGLDSNVTS